MKRKVLIIGFIGYILLLVRLIIFKYPVPMLRGIMDEWDVDMVKRGYTQRIWCPLKQ